MRIYTDILGVEHDLDNPETYKHLPQTEEAVISKLYEQIGYSRVYMVEHGFLKDDRCKDQVERIDELINTIISGYYVEKGLMWWQERLFLFDNEIENMC